MKIFHIAPFGPGRCGLYEAARDMLRADVISGHDGFFVNAGVTINGVRQEPKHDEVDDRSGFKITCTEPKELNKADIIIMHTGAPDNWIVKCQAPLIWVVHGRPLACFRPESTDSNKNSYSLYKHVSEWQRTKYMLYFWEQFNDHWNFLLNDKELLLNNPVIDLERFNKYSPVIDDYKFVNQGDVNFVICDSNREDICLYEMIVACIKFSKTYKDIPELSGINFKFHIYGLDFPLVNCWNLLLTQLQNLGTLGDLEGRVKQIEKPLIAADFLLSPNYITVRTIAEAIACDTPVITESGSKIADFTTNWKNTDESAKTLIRASLMRVKNKGKLIPRKDRDDFSGENYSKIMNVLYEKIRLDD